MERWNNADTTLLCAACCFLIATGARILNPDSFLTEGFLFVTEAAMVGGIADWFAVTALFKKPLGFPFHTAILPRRREDFIKASVKMVETEFFSRRTIFKKLGSLNLLPHVIKYLEKPDTRKNFLTLLLDEMKNMISSIDREAAAKKLSFTLRRELGDIPTQRLINELGYRIKRSEKDKEIFLKIAGKIHDEAKKPETKIKIQNVLEKYAEEKTQAAGIFSMLMSGLAQMLDVVNFEEAAEIIQAQLVKMTKELLTDSPTQRKVLNECRMKIAELADTPEFRDTAQRIQLDFAAKLSPGKDIENALNHLTQQILSVNISETLDEVQKSGVKNSKNPGVLIVNFLNEEYEKLLELLKADGSVKNSLQEFLRELAARTALYAQPLAGEIAKDALGKLDDEQLNSLVYDKAEEDFVWIRMNGSIVGAIVGVMIFILIKAVGGVI